MSKILNLRPIYEIASDIRKNWKSVNYAAAPYLNAMDSLDKITDKYGADDAKTIIVYFLANAQSFRGKEAKRIKKELNKLITSIE